MPLLKRAGSGWLHWCPACGMRHRLPDSWKFDGNQERPTFDPSFRHSWSDPSKKVCHYNVIKGQLQYAVDSTHALRGQTVPMVPLPESDDHEA